MGDPSGTGEQTVRRALSVALAGVTLTLLALMFAAVPLFVPGIALALLGAAAPAWVWLSARGASVERRLRTGRVIEDQPLEVVLDVDAPRRRLASCQVLDPLAQGPVELPARERSQSLTICVRFPRRGRYRLAPPVLSFRDPLELAEHTITSARRGSEILVLPRTFPLRSLDEDAGGLGSEASGARAHALAAVDLDGLRPYRAGTPAARIHWPAFARGAGLLERRLRAEADSRPLIVLDARGAVKAEHLDCAVRAAASLVLELARGGGCGLLLPGDRRPSAIGLDLAGWPSAHARLAVVRGGVDAPAPALRVAGARLGSVYYVAARGLDGLPGAAHGIARGTAVLVYPAELAGSLARSPQASFEVAGCFGFQVRGRRPRLRGTPNVADAAAGDTAAGEVAV